MNAPHTSETSLLDAKLLRLFDLLYTTGSVTRTAEQLGQSQVVREHFDTTGRPIQHFELLAPRATYELRMPLRDFER